MDPLRLTYSLRALINTTKGKISYHNFIFYFCLQSVKCLIIYMYKLIFNYILWTKILGKPMNSLTGLLSRGFKNRRWPAQSVQPNELLFTAGGDDRRRLRLFDGRRIDTCPFPRGGEWPQLSKIFNFKYLCAIEPFTNWFGIHKALKMRLWNW